MMIPQVMLATGLSLILAVPAAAADSVTEFALQGSVAGLVAVSQTAAGSQVSFALSGLRPNTKYRLVVGKGRCTGGAILKRGFRTDKRGVAWDPVAVRATARPRSVWIEKGGRMLVCNPGPIRLGAASVVKVTQPRSLVTVAQAAKLWRVSLAVTGLQPNTRYEFHAKQGGCGPEAVNLFDDDFTTNRRGFGMMEVQRTPVRGRTIDAVVVDAHDSGEILFCQAL